jgi:hypothetical protein
MDIELAQALAENELLKSLLYCTKRSCNNCGKVNCENFQRQRKDCCGNWVSYKDYIKKLEAQIEKMKKYGKLLQDICDVMGNDPYMVWRGLEQRVLILWDKSEEEKGLKMADDILERLLKLSAIDWAEIEKWEIKEND